MSCAARALAANFLELHDPARVNKAVAHAHPSFRATNSTGKMCGLLCRGVDQNNSHWTPLDCLMITYHVTHPLDKKKENIIYGRASPLGNERQVQMTGKDTFGKSSSKFKFEALSAVRYLLYNTIY